MHAISSYRGNRHRPPATNTHTHRQDRLQYTALLASAQCKKVPVPVPGRPPAALTSHCRVLAVDFRGHVINREDRRGKFARKTDDARDAPCRRAGERTTLEGNGVIIALFVNHRRGGAAALANGRLVNTVAFITPKPGRVASQPCLGLCVAEKVGCRFVAKEKVVWETWVKYNMCF